MTRRTKTAVTPVADTTDLCTIPDYAAGGWRASTLLNTLGLMTALPPVSCTKANIKAGRSYLIVNLDLF
jgi:hypothetical protein